MAKQNYQVGLLITGDAKKGVKATKLTRDGLKDLSTQQRKTSKTTKNLTSKTGSMIGKLGLVTGVVGLATAAFGAMATIMRTQTITEMKVMADTLNLSTQTLSEWSAAGEKFNVGGEKMADIFKDLQDKIGDFAATGGGEAKEVFEKLNLDINEFVGLSADKQLLKIGSALDDVASHSEKIFFMEALANDASRLLPLLENNAKGLRSAQNEARVLGTSISDIDAGIVAEAGREFQRTKDIALGLGNEITIALSPAFIGMNDRIIDTIASMGGWEGSAHSVFDNVTIWTEQFGEVWSLLKEDFNITDEVNAIDSAFGEIGKFSGDFIDELSARFDYLFEVLRDYPAHYRTIVGIVFGEVQILWKKIQLGTVLFFSFLDEGWQNMSHAAGKAWGFVELSFANLSDSIIEMMGTAIQTVADGLSLIPGMSKQAASVEAAAQALNGMAVAGARVEAQQAASNVEHEKQLAIISLVRDLEKAKNKASIKEINDRILLIIKERDVLIAKSDDARKAAKKVREEEAKARITDASKTLGSPPTVVRTDTRQISEDYDKLIKQVDDFSGAWASAGNVIVDTFGTIGQQMEKLFVSQDKYAQAIKFNHAEQAKGGENLKKLKADEIKLNYASTQSQLNSYGSIAGAAAGMFKENSKAAKVAHGIEQALAIASLAMSIEKMLMSSTETAVVVGNETVKQVALGTTAIITQGQGDPYSAFARIAAMAAIVAGLGILTSGGSGSAPTSSAERQESQSRGTVLGSDDKSASLNNSFERIEELELDQYAELREMNASLNDLNKNITHLAASIVGDYGKFDDKNFAGDLGTIKKSALGFSSTKKSLVDSGISIVAQTMGDIIDSGLLQARAYFDVKTKKKSWWGLSSSTSYQTTYDGIGSKIEHEMALIFGDIGNSINSAVDVLGLDVSKNLDNFIIDLPNISFKDLSGDEIQSELEAMFSSQADLMATYLVPGLQEFQKVGEGLYETLIRIAQEQAVFNGILELTGHSLSNIDATKQIEVTQSIIGFAGSIEALSSAANTYFSEFFTEAEQFDYLTKQLNEQFSALGVSLPETRDGFKALIGELDPLNESDQRLYASLLLLAGQTDQYYDSIESGIGAINGITAAERERADFLKSFSDQLTRLDMSDLMITLVDFQKEWDAYFDEAKTLGADTSLLETLYAKERQSIIDNALADINDSHQQSMDTLTRDHDNAVNNLVSSNQKLVSSFASLSASIANSILSIRRQGSTWSESSYQTSKISDLSALLGEGSVEDQISNIDSLQQAYVNKYNADLQGLNNSRDAAQSAYDEQLSQIESRYQAELKVYNGMRSALDSLKDAVDNLLLSDLSTLTNEQKLAESKSQYQNTLALAKGGDANAISQLADKQSNYLSEAQGYYASSDAYKDIFNSVFGEASQISTTSISAPSQQRAPAVPASISSHNARVRELQLETVGSLEELQLLNKELEEQSKTAFDIAMSDLNALLNDNTIALEIALETNTQAIYSTSAEQLNVHHASILQQAKVDDNQTKAIKELTSNMMRELKDVKAAVEKSNAKLEQRVQQETQKAADAEKRADELLKQLLQRDRIQERQTDEFMRNIA